MDEVFGEHGNFVAQVSFVTRARSAMRSATLDISSVSDIHRLWYGKSTNDFLKYRQLYKALRDLRANPVRLSYVLTHLRSWESELDTLCE